MPSIQIPANMAASTTAQIGQFMSDFDGMIILVLGLIGVSVVVSIIISALHGHR